LAEPKLSEAYIEREADWFDFFYFPRYINQCEKISRRVWSWLRM